MHFPLPKPLHGWRQFAGEVGVIVLGVLIALAAGQVVEWAHWRHQQHDVLERLFQEARSDVAVLRNRRDSLRVTAQREADFATTLTSGSCPPESEWTAVMEVTKFPAVATETSVYDEVVGAGGLAQISSPEAREAVSDFHSKLAWLESTTGSFRLKSSHPFQLDDPRVTIRYNPRTADPEVVIFDRQLLCRDRGFRNRVADGVRNYVTWTHFHDVILKSAIRMCATLGELVGKECTPLEGGSLRRADLQVANAAVKDLRGRH
jgi:hypothetical protein